MTDFLLGGDEGQKKKRQRDLAKYHLCEALRASIAEEDGNEDLARRLFAETKLRLISMSDEELWELAKQTAEPFNRPVDQAYKDYKQRVEEILATASE